VGRPEEKRPLERIRGRWDYNIKMDIRYIGCTGMDWIHLAEDTIQWLIVMNSVMSIWIP
jgi:hypothetical protein